MDAVFILLSLLAGGLLAVQAGANAQLANPVGSVFGATAIQLSVGAVPLALLASLTGGLAAPAGVPGCLGGTPPVGPHPRLRRLDRPSLSAAVPSRMWWKLRAA
jgi:Putative inner membrane exporter, YdcZ